MEAQKFIIRYGCNDFVFEGSILELASVIRSLEKLTPVIYASRTGTYEETGLKKRLRIYSAKDQYIPDANYPNYSIDA